MYVSVLCPHAKGFTDEDLRIGYELGRRLALADHYTITMGGGSMALAVAQGAFEASGDVVRVISEVQRPCILYTRVSRIIHDYLGCLAYFVDKGSAYIVMPGFEHLDLHALLYVQIHRKKLEPEKPIILLADNADDFQATVDWATGTAKTDAVSRFMKHASTTQEAVALLDQVPA